MEGPVEYDVTDHEATINGHEMVIRVLVMVTDEPARDIVYVSCQTCEEMTEMTFDWQGDIDSGMELIRMEAVLHSEGFVPEGTEWEHGSLVPLD